MRILVLAAAAIGATCSAASAAQCAPAAALALLAPWFLADSNKCL
jgi:hypothetical protein